MKNLFIVGHRAFVEFTKTKAPADVRLFLFDCETDLIDVLRWGNINPDDVLLLDAAMLSDAFTVELAEFCDRITMIPVVADGSSRLTELHHLYGGKVLTYSDLEHREFKFRGLLGLPAISHEPQLTLQLAVA